MQAGWKGLFAIEKDINAFETLSTNLIHGDTGYRYSWPKWLPKKRRSVASLLDKFREHLIGLEGQVDMLVGGPPCQGFSSAGRRDPNDPRNKLVRDYLRIVRLLKPRIVVIENVRGITSDFSDATAPTGRINYSEWIQSALAENYVVFSKLLDSSLFGVPQKRMRFFIIAIRVDEVKRRKFENPFELIERSRTSFVRSQGIGPIPVSSKSALSDLEIERNGTAQSRDSAGFDDIAYKSPLTAYQRLMHSRTDTQPSDTRIARHRPEISSRFRKLIKLCHADGRLNISLSAEMRATFGLKKLALRVLDPDAPSPTITSMPDDLLHYSEPRTLTVRENARLQGFPDWFAYKGKYTTGGNRRKKEVPRFTQVANAVPPLIAQAIGLSLADFLTTSVKKPARATPQRVTRKSLDALEALI
jgi:DNA (cytosine-5)-methyltransferase 1